MQLFNHNITEVYFTLKGTFMFCRKEILNRIVELQSGSNSNMSVERPLQSPPSYQEATRSDEERSSIFETSEPPVSYNQLSSMLNELRTDIEHSSTAIVLFSCDNSQVFFIPDSGQVTSPSERSNVKIFMLEGNYKKLFLS